MLELPFYSNQVLFMENNLIAVSSIRSIQPGDHKREAAIINVAMIHVFVQY